MILTNCRFTKFNHLQKGHSQNLRNLFASENVQDYSNNNIIIMIIMIILIIINKIILKTPGTDFRKYFVATTFQPTYLGLLQV